MHANVSVATRVITASRCRDGPARLAELEARHGHEPWWQDRHDDFTGNLARWPVRRRFGLLCADPGADANGRDPHVDVVEVS